MTDSGREWFAKLFWVACYFSLSILSAGCSDVKELQYDTAVNHEELLNLEGKKLALISFASNTIKGDGVEFRRFFFHLYNKGGRG